MMVRFQTDLMVQLSDFGFKKGVIYESIVSTLNPDSTPNAAPMGIKIQDEKHLSLNIFNTSATLLNLKAKKCAVINFTGDIEIFYKSTFKEANPNGKVPAEWFVQADFVEAPKLRFADIIVEASAMDFKQIGSEKTEITCRTEHITSEAKYPQLYSRAVALTIEAIIHGTRVKTCINNPQKQVDTAKLVEKIRDYADVVERVAPNSIYTTVLNDLQKRIEMWRKKP
ncbi:MAG: DUF447 family protein [Nitrososphaerota archaeon]|jgi:hypothetical protein|nr:DUF447 family protein [Nitrososphaerota archaeon]